MRADGRGVSDMDLIEEAFERAGYDLQMLTGRHLESARRSLSMIANEWQNVGINSFDIDRQTLTLQPDVETYTLPPGTVDIVDMPMLKREPNSEMPVIRISRSDWTALVNKATPGRPDRFYVERVQSPVLRLWPTPDKADTLTYWRMFDLSSDGIDCRPTVNPLFTDALAASLAHRMASKMPMDRRDGSLIQSLDMEKQRSLELARRRNADTASMTIW